VTIRFIASALL